MARLIKAITGVVDGEVYPREIEAGTDCPPELEAAAAEFGALESDEDRIAREKAEADAAKATEKSAAKGAGDK